MLTCVHNLAMGEVFMIGNIFFSLNNFSFWNATLMQPKEWQNKIKQIFLYSSEYNFWIEKSLNFFTPWTLIGIKWGPGRFRRFDPSMHTHLCPFGKSKFNLYEA